MPKRNSSGASRGRRTSSSARSTPGSKPFKKSRNESGDDSRPNRKGGKTAGRSFGKSEGTGKSFRKSESGDDFRPSRKGPKTTGRSFSKSEGTGKSFRKNESGDDFRPSRKGAKTTGRSFNKSEGTGKSFRKNESGDDFRPNRRGDKPPGRSFTKSGGPGKSFRKSESGGDPRPDRRGGKTPGRSFNKSGGTGKPFRKREEGGFSEKRGAKFGGNESDEKKPYGKRPFGGKRSSTREEGSSSYPPKKFGSRKKEQDSDDRQSRSSSDKRPTKFSGSRKKADYSEEIPVQSEKIRLNKFIANSGVSSRREADELITMGLISVNGKTITELGYKVNPGDEVRYESRVLRAEKPVYILLNKPKGYLTTTSDPQERNTVMHIIGNAVKERIYPVGRLDRNTTGLLLLTNDGDLADKLMHPSYNAKKIYKVELDRPLTKADFQRILEGIPLEEGRAMVDDLAIISDDGKTVGIELHIGWNRVVRRIFESMEYEVVKLDRSVYAGLDKKDLPRGHWRFLTKEEVIRLKHYK